LVGPIFFQKYSGEQFSKVKFFCRWFGLALKHFPRLLARLIRESVLKRRIILRTHSKAPRFAQSSGVNRKSRVTLIRTRRLSSARICSLNHFRGRQRERDQESI